MLSPETVQKIKQLWPRATVKALFMELMRDNPGINYAGFKAVVEGRKEDQFLENLILNAATKRQEAINQNTELEARLNKAS